MRTQSRKRQRPAPSPDETEKNALTGAGPAAQTLSSDSESSGDEARTRSASVDSITNRLPPIALTADDRIDVSKLRSNTKERLKKALADPKLASELGISAPSASTGDEAKMFTEHVAPALFGALNSLLVSFPRRYGYTAEQAQVMAFDAGEIASMAPLAGKVLAKHVGVGGKYQEELLLATVVLSGIMAKVTLLEKTATVLRLQRTQPTVATTTAAEQPAPAL